MHQDIIDMNTRKVLHVGVTGAPTEQWTAQQLRNATEFCEGPPFLIRDRDAKFGVLFDRVAKGADTKVIRCPIRAPLVNSVCERYLGSVRRECLDHMMILGEAHLRSVLAEYECYFNTARPHQSLGQVTPVATELQSYCEGAVVEAFPVLGGLHNEYRVAA